MNRVHDLPDVALLELLHAGVEREDLVVEDRPDRDAVHIVARVERVSLDVHRRRAQVDPPALEQHHVDVHPAVARIGHPAAQSVEELLVERLQIELRLPVRRLARSGARPRLGRHAQVVVGRGGVGAELLPSPQTDEVVAALLEEVEILAEVHPLRIVRARLPRPHPIVEVVPQMGAGQVDGSLVGPLANREVSRVPRRHHERPRCPCSTLRSIVQSLLPRKKGSHDPTTVARCTSALFVAEAAGSRCGSDGSPWGADTGGDAEAQTRNPRPGGLGGRARLHGDDLLLRPRSRTARR